MPIAKKNNYAELELDWIEAKLLELKKYVDANPIDKLTDRVAYKVVKGGGTMPIVIADIEKQIKSIRDTLADYLKFTEAVSKLRETEETKKKSQARGDQELSPLEQGMLDG